MPFKNEILPNLPVIYTHYTGQLSANILEESMMDLPAYIQQIQRPIIFQILDVRNSDIDFNETLLFFNKISKNRPEWLDKLTFEVMFVGTNNMTKFSTQLLAQDQFGGLSIPIFKTFDDAIAYIQTRINNMIRK
ncbi:MAG: hypothetical protein CUN52_06360 [Phototrophicales bacterium]|nr:MAG: hypothetical protein CUN52_06360 [Phototrophicales bacterium]